MNHTLKSGDMAMIKPNSKAPHLAGKSVELVLCVGPGFSHVCRRSLAQHIRDGTIMDRHW